jgi:copper chaperone CopZ
MLETAVLDVRGMHCGGCERTVRQAVTELAGVERCVPEHIGDEVEVVFDPEQVGIEQIRVAIVAAGFIA